MLQQHASITDCYSDYIEKSKEIAEKVTIFDGAFGMKSVSKSHPIHNAFYEEVQSLVATVNSEIDTDTIFSYIELMLFSPAENMNSPCFWMLYAAQQHCIPLLQYLSKEKANEYLSRFEVLYPKRARFPAQKKVYEAIKSRCK